MKIKIIAHPNSKKPRIEKDMLKNTHVYVKEPALDGKANKAISEALAKKYGLPKSRIRIIKGIKSRVKLFELEK
jgi:uncharacterized protein YggU (UPF0235/DUF167 family)